MLFLENRRLKGRYRLPFPEGGEMDVGCSQPVQQIQPESAFLAGLVQILVRGRDDADIDRYRNRFRYTEDGFLFQNNFCEKLSYKKTPKKEEWKMKKAA